MAKIAVVLVILCFVAIYDAESAGKAKHRHGREHNEEYDSEGKRYDGCNEYGSENPGRPVRPLRPEFEEDDEFDRADPLKTSSFQKHERHNTKAHARSHHTGHKSNRDKN